MLRLNKNSKGPVKAQAHSYPYPYPYHTYPKFSLFLIIPYLCDVSCVPSLRYSSRTHTRTWSAAMPRMVWDSTNHYYRKSRIISHSHYKVWRTTVIEKIHFHAHNTHFTICDHSKMTPLVIYIMPSRATCKVGSKRTYEEMSKTEISKEVKSKCAQSQTERTWLNSNHVFSRWQVLSASLQVHPRGEMYTTSWEKEVEQLGTYFGLRPLATGAWSAASAIRLR
jgi:hypothetical protein